MQYLRYRFTAYITVCQRDAHRNGKQHFFQRTLYAAKAEGHLNKPDTECRGYAAQCRQAGIYRPAQPNHGRAAVLLAAQRRKDFVAKRDFTQNQKCGNKFKPAHAAHQAGRCYQQIVANRHPAAPPCAAAEPKRGQKRQHPGPQAPVQVFHAALRPRAEHNREQPRCRRQQAKFPPEKQTNQQFNCIKQGAVCFVKHDLTVQPAGPAQRIHLIQDTKAPALQPGLMGIHPVVALGYRLIIQELLPVVAFFLFRRVHAHKTARPVLVILHLQHTPVHQCL